MDISTGERIWRWLANFWTIAFLIFVVLNFFLEEQFGFLITPFSVLYIGVLSLYVSTKEFDRWYEMHKGKHPGEIFVIVWTIVVLGLFAVSITLNKNYQMDEVIVAVYIAVLSIFAVTQKSKRLHKEKLLKQKRNS